MKERIDESLKFLIKIKGSDLHIKAGSTIHYRLDGELAIYNDTVVTNEEVEEMAQAILEENEYKTLQETKELDLPESVEQPTTYQMGYFYDACTGKKPPFPSAREHLKAVQIARGSVLAMRERRHIDIAEVD